MQRFFLISLIMGISGLLSSLTMAAESEDPFRINRFGIELIIDAAAKGNQSAKDRLLDAVFMDDLSPYYLEQISLAHVGIELDEHIPDFSLLSFEKLFAVIKLSKNTVVLKKLREFLSLGGNGESCFLLGYCNQYGYGDSKNLDNAKMFYDLATKDNVAAAWVKKYQMEVGQNKEILSLSFFTYLFKAASLRHPKALMTLGKLQLAPINTTRNNQGREECRSYKLYLQSVTDEEEKKWFKEGREALALIEEAAQLGSAHAMFLLASFHEQGVVYAKNMQEARRLYQVSAEAGFVHAQSEMTAIHCNDHEYQKAFVYSYQAAVQEQHVEHEVTLARFLLNGWGAKPNPKAALVWYMKAAKRGLAEAILEANRLFDELLQIDQRPEDIYDVTNKLMGLINVEPKTLLKAQQRLSQMLEDGIGCQPDAAEAKRYLELAEITRATVLKVLPGGRVRTLANVAIQTPFLENFFAHAQKEYSLMAISDRIFNDSVIIKSPQFKVQLDELLDVISGLSYLFPNNSALAVVIKSFASNLENHNYMGQSKKFNEACNAMLQQTEVSVQADHVKELRETLQAYGQEMENSLLMLLAIDIMEATL